MHQTQDYLIHFLTGSIEQLLFTITKRFPLTLMI